MRLLTRFTNGEWSDLLPSEEDDGDSTDYQNELRQSLTEFFRSENLVVLTGLGTSLCIIDPDEELEDDEDPTPLAPTMWDLWTNIRDRVTPEKFDDICTHVKQPTYEDKKTGEELFVEDIELLLSKCLLAQEFTPAIKVRRFIKDAESTIVELCDFLSDEIPLPTHEAFLRRIARRPTRHPRTKLFTTNYDLAFETAASRIRFTTVDGFSHTLPQEFDSSYFSYDLVRRDEDGSAPDYIPNVFHLYKVHGSIDWQKSEHQVVKQIAPDKPVLIYPRHSKFELSYESPFLDLISRFQAALRQTNTSLLIVGFGFNDKHLTQPILSAIRSNVGLRTMVVSPSLEDAENDAIGTIEALIQSGDSRLGLVAGTFQDFVPYLPDLVPETEEERHAKRLRGDM